MIQHEALSKTRSKDIHACAFREILNYHRQVEDSDYQRDGHGDNHRYEVTFIKLIGIIPELPKKIVDRAADWS